MERDTSVPKLYWSNIKKVSMKIRGNFSSEIIEMLYSVTVATSVTYHDNFVGNVLGRFGRYFSLSSYLP